MRAVVAFALVLAVAVTANADEPAPPPVAPPPPPEDPATAGARDAAKLFFMAVANGEDSYLRDAMRAPVRYQNLVFEDTVCARRFSGKGTVMKSALGKFAKCVVTMGKRRPAGELAFVIAAGERAGEQVVTATGPDFTFELVLLAARDGSYHITALRRPGPPAPSGEVRPPSAADLDGYLKGLPGKGKKLVATIATSMGDLTCELFLDAAPATVANFVGLATGKKPWLDPATNAIKKGVKFYDGLTFHRVIPEFMVQGGDPVGNGTGGPGYKFENETSAKLVHGPGTLSMANSGGTGTNGSQFFVTEKATSWLDGRHTVFGKCAEVELVKKIARVPVDRDRPKTPVTIRRVTFRRAR